MGFLYCFIFLMRGPRSKVKNHSSRSVSLLIMHKYPNIWFSIVMFRIMANFTVIYKNSHRHKWYY